MSFGTSLVDTQCPYCGEPISLVIDGGHMEEEFAGQEYVEDCQVCCRPLHVSVTFAANSDGFEEPMLAIRGEDEC